jgi:LysM repeat protein
MDFQELQRHYNELREQFDADQISEEEFRDEIEGLQIQDEQGRYWTIGAQSGQWYRFDGREWVQETPIPMTKHQGRKIPEPVSPAAARREAPAPIVPRWLATGCAGLALLAVVAVLIIVGWNALRGQRVAISQEATPTLSSGLPVNTPTPAPTPSPTATVPATNTPLAFKVYSNSTFGFSLQYPGDWQAKEADRQAIFAPQAEGLTTSIVSKTVVTGEVFVVGLQAESIAGSPSELLTQFAATLPTQTSAIETGFRSVGQTEWAISQVTLTGSNSMSDMTAYVAATSRGGQVYTVLAAAPAADWNTLAPIFQQMFDSFRFTAAPQVAMVSPTPALAKTPAMTVSVTATVKAAATSVMTSTPVARATPATYVVQEGDTLMAIAIRFDVTVEALQSANGITDPSKLRTGQSLVIPVGGVVAVAKAATPTSGQAPASPGQAPASSGQAAASPGQAVTTTVAAASTPAAPKPTAEPTPTPAPPEAALSGKFIFPVFDPNRVTQGQPGIYDIVMTDPQGNNRQVIAYNASQPSVNPGGDLLAYRSWDPKSRGVAFLTIGGGRGGLLSKYLEDGLPSWAPDSITMAFSSRREGDRVPRLYRVDQTNGAEHSIRLIGEYESTFADGRLVFKGCTVEGACGMFTAGPEGGTTNQISSETSDTAPTPSPDGSTIAFMSFNREGANNWEIYVMSSGGGDATRLTNDHANDGLPAWSPDGKTLAFVSDRDGSWGIWAMSPDGSNQRKLFDMGGSPDGKVGFDVNNSKGWLEERICWSR